MAWSRVIGEDEFGSFKTGFGFAYKVKYGEAEKSFRAELELALVQVKTNVVNFASKIIKQEQAAFIDSMTQYVAAAEARFQSEAAAAQRFFDSVTNNMPSDNVRALRKVVELHGHAYAAQQFVIEENIEYQHKLFLW